MENDDEDRECKDVSHGLDDYTRPEGRQGSMTTQDKKKWAGRLGMLTLLVGLATAAKAAGESWFVPQRDWLAWSYKHDSAQAIRDFRDSTRHVQLVRQIVYERCQRTRGAGEYCLSPERP